MPQGKKREKQKFLNTIRSSVILSKLYYMISYYR